MDEEDVGKEVPRCSYCEPRVPIPGIRKLIIGLSLYICDSCLRECFNNAIKNGWDPNEKKDKNAP